MITKELLNAVFDLKGRFWKAPSGTKIFKLKFNASNFAKVCPDFIYQTSDQDEKSKRPTALVMNSPPLKTGFGYSPKLHEGKVSNTLRFSFDDKEESAVFRNAIETIEEWILDKALENAKKYTPPKDPKGKSNNAPRDPNYWGFEYDYDLNDEMNRKMISKNFRRLIRKPSDEDGKEYPDYIQFKIEHYVKYEEDPKDKKKLLKF